MNQRDISHRCNDGVSCSNENCRTLSRNDELFQKRWKRVLEALSLKPLSFNEVVKQSGLNPLYAKQCLDYLVSEKRVNRTPEEAKGARGRPRVFYSSSSNTTQQKPKPSAHLDIDRLIRESKTSEKPKLPSTVAVEVEFKKLKDFCRFEKSGNCKQRMQFGFLPKCELSKCPLVLKTRLVGRT